MTRLSRFIQDTYVAHRGAEEPLEARIAYLEGQLRRAENAADRLRSLLARQVYLGQRDVLTGLLNRRAYQEQLDNYYKRWLRYGDGLVMLVVDIDSFKSINDLYGHLMGDKVLKQVAKQLRKSFREYDLVARVGGEEFVIVLERIGLQDAQKVADKARELIAQTRVNISQRSVPITVSIGLAEFKNDDKPEDVFERADKALYEAKNQGRNKVECLK